MDIVSLVQEIISLPSARLAEGLIVICMLLYGAYTLYRNYALLAEAKKMKIEADKKMAELDARREELKVLVRRDFGVTKKEVK